MKKIIIAFAISLIFIPPPASAVDSCSDCCDTIKSNHMPQNTEYYWPGCPSIVSVQNKYTFGGCFCGSNAQNEAASAIVSGYPIASGYAGLECGCGNNSEAGWDLRRMSQTTFVGVCPEGGSFTGYINNYTLVVWCKTCTEDVKYCITKGWSCPSGAAVALQIEICDEEGYPTGATNICGNSDIAEKIDSGEIPGNVFTNPNCNCDLTEQQVSDMCDQIDPTMSDCDDCSTRDTDGDGVNDCDDWCPDTMSGATVSAHGCPENDQDGDGVLDGVDQCPDTPPNVQVDTWGCPIEINSELDTDGDGIPNIEDSCPNDGGIVNADGCPVINPPPPENPDGGDQDNDNPLLEAIISWLQKLIGNSDKTNQKLDKIEGELEGINEKLDASGVETSLPDDDDDFDGELPEDYEAIDLDDDFMSSFFNRLVQNNAFIQQISGSTLSASGACSLSTTVSIFGRSVSLNFSICEYDLTVFRAMILMLAGLTGFFIVFRKG